MIELRLGGQDLSMEDLISPLSSVDCSQDSETGKRDTKEGGRRNKIYKLFSQEWRYQESEII